MQPPSFKFTPKADDSDLVVYCKLDDDQEQDPTVELMEGDQNDVKGIDGLEKSYFHENQQFVINLLIFTGIFSVVLFNLWPSTFPNACAGSDIYFVVSGFVAAIQCVHMPADQFYRSRFQQIVPIYIIILFFVLLLDNGPFFNIDAWNYVWSTGAGLIFFSNKVDYTRPIRELKASFLGHLWLPSLLVQFYVLSPSLSRFLRAETRQPARWAFVIGIGLSSLIYGLCADVQQFNRPLLPYETIRLSRKTVDELSVDFVARLWPFLVGFALAIVTSASPESIPKNDDSNAEKTPLRDSLSSPAHSPIGPHETKRPRNFHEIDLSAVHQPNCHNDADERRYGGDMHRYSAISMILIVTIILMPDLGAGGPYAVLFLRQCTVVGAAVALFVVVAPSDDADVTFACDTLADAMAFGGRLALIWYLLHWPIAYAVIRVFRLGYLESGVCALIASLILAIGIRKTLADWIEKFERFRTVVITCATFYALSIILIIQESFF